MATEVSIGRGSRISADADSLSNNVAEQALGKSRVTTTVASRAVGSGNGMGSMLGKGARSVVSPVTPALGPGSPAPTIAKGKGGRKAANPHLSDDERRRERVLKNRESAMKSLQKKKRYTEDLESRAVSLQSRNADLKLKIRQLLARLSISTSHDYLSSLPPLPDDILPPSPGSQEIQAQQAMDNSAIGPQPQPMLPSQSQTVVGPFSEQLTQQHLQHTHQLLQQQQQQQQQHLSHNQQSSQSMSSSHFQSSPPQIPGSFIDNASSSAQSSSQYPQFSMQQVAPAPHLMLPQFDQSVAQAAHFSPSHAARGIPAAPFSIPVLNAAAAVTCPPPTVLSESLFASLSEDPAFDGFLSQDAAHPSSAQGITDQVHDF